MFNLGGRRVSKITVAEARCEKPPLVMSKACAAMDMLPATLSVCSASKCHSPPGARMIVPPATSSPMSLVIVCGAKPPAIDNVAIVPANNCAVAVNLCGANVICNASAM